MSRKIITTPFVAQLDEIDRAILNHRYNRHTHKYPVQRHHKGYHHNNVNNFNNPNNHVNYHNYQTVTPLPLAHHHHHHHHQQQQQQQQQQYNVVASSPDSFVEGVISSPVSNHLNLSSSVSSGSSSDFDFKVNSFTASHLDYNTNNQKNMFIGQHQAQSGFNRATDNNLFHNNTQGLNSSAGQPLANNLNDFDLNSIGNTTNNSRSTWLNIWGKDMSVWG